jgi:hypothetical protein
MSKRGRTIRAAHRRSDLTKRPVTRLRGPGDVIAMIPYLLGFTANESLVVIVLEGPTRRFGPCFRMDLVAHRGEAADQARYIRALVQHHSFCCVMIFAFSDLVEPAQTVLDTAQQELASAGVEVVDAIRADGTRWWSLTCSDPRCCGSEGSPYDVDSSPVAAEAVFAGLQRAPDRESLRAQVAPLDEERRAAVAAAAAAALPGDRVEGMVTAGLGRADQLSIEGIAALAAAVQDVTARDRAWALMRRATAGEHFQLWRLVMQSVPDYLLSPVGSLAAFAAWLNGSGVLASHAAERVLSVDPGYSMALLVVDALDACLHPDSWERGRPALSHRSDAPPPTSTAPGDRPG